MFLSQFVVGFPFIIRVAITIILVSCNGFFMGFMMPSGIRAVSKVEDAIPWMWSINSVFSIVASFMAIYLALIFGFSFVLLAAVLAYAIGTLAFVIKRV
jgi:hypothetical protein